MKTLPLKGSKTYILIGGAIAASFLGYLLVSALNTRMLNYIEEFNRKVPREVAFLVTEEFAAAIIAETGGFDLSRFHQYNRNNTRLALKRMIQHHPNIHLIMLIDPENRIVISTNPKLEDETFRAVAEQERLSLKVPQLTVTDTSGAVPELDVIWPVRVKNQFRGHIRMWMSINQLHNLHQARVFVLWGASVAVGALIILALWFTWRVNRLSQNPGNFPATASPEARTEGAPEPVQNGSSGTSLFSRLSELYNKGTELDKSFQQSEKKAHSMMRVLNQGLLILDNNMQIITSNEYILDVFNIRTKSSAQRKVYEIIQKNPRLLEIYRRAKDPLTHEVKQIFDLMLLNGRKINVEVLARPFYDGEMVNGVTFYIKNLDMLNELEQTLQRSMKYGVISQLSSSIGHEIRNPLSSLAIHTEIVDSMVDKSVEDKQRLEKIKKSINILNSEVERLQKLIDQFFNLAKAQEIRLTYENINDLMEEIGDLVHQQALENNVQITRYFSKNIPMVKVSKDQLKQVIINLILNALDAMPEGGDLTLRTDYREGFVVISIKDTGTGIPENIRDNIFDLYFTTKASGGGIGLAISRKIIEAHEGNLYFETKTGVGTIFYIELPTSQN